MQYNHDRLVIVKRRPEKYSLQLALPVAGSSNTRRVSTFELGQKILAQCAQRSDDWALEIQGRMHSCNDLIAAEAVYHKVCHSRFMNNLSCSVGDSSRGRPRMVSAMKAFEQMCYQLETTCEQNIYSVEELHNMMSDFCADEDKSELYSVKHIKRLLQDRYGDSIVFAEVNGRRNVVCFTDVCHVILSDKWYQEKETDDSIMEKIVKDAANLIASEIRQMPCTTSQYPAVDEMSVQSDVVPPLLRLFIDSLVRSEVKQSSLAQALIQAARPQTCIMPLLFGTGVELDHEFRSEFLLKHLSRLGFSVSYDEVKRFKMSVMQASCGENVSDDSAQMSESSQSDFNNHFTQFCADNLDHNIQTLDGNNTFHCMGMIAADVVDHGTQSLHAGGRIQRLTRRVSVANVSQSVRVPIVNCLIKSGSGLSTIELKTTRSLQSPVVFPPVVNLNMLWHVYGIKQQPDLPRPNWAGFMQTVCIGEHPPVSQLYMLPIIDLKPTDETCIFSTLLFLIDQARKFRQSVPCVTFDQPLYIKALDISSAAKLDIVCHLGSFHTLVNFIGAIGYIMNGSGLEDMMGLLYGPSTVEYVQSGKAYARAIRGHFIVQDALVQTLLLSVISVDCYTTGLDPYSMPLPIPGATEAVELIHSLYHHVWNTKFDVHNSSNLDFENLCQFAVAFRDIKCALSQESRTSQLWIRYIDYVDIIKLFLIAERTSDWTMHLDACQAMLNLFAASGHYNYAKACRIYVQQMLDLRESYQTLHEQFVRGNHTIRRSNRLWVGLSCDLVIEQTLMKSAKRRGGLTRGRGMQESVRQTWTSTLNECTSIHLAMSCTYEAHRFPHKTTTRTKNEERPAAPADLDVPMKLQRFAEKWEDEPNVHVSPSIPVIVMLTDRTIVIDVPPPLRQPTPPPPPPPEPFWEAPCASAHELAAGIVQWMDFCPSDNANTIAQAVLTPLGNISNGQCRASRAAIHFSV